MYLRTCRCDPVLAQHVLAGALGVPDAKASGECKTPEALDVSVEVFMHCLEPFMDVEVSKSSIILGCVEDGVYERELFRSKQWTPFESRAGGTPAWLVPLPAGLVTKRLRCGSCKRQLRFLLQVYAPRGHNAAAFHRVLYLFICAWCASRSADNSGAARVYRVQLPQHNSWYPDQVEDLEALRRYPANLSAGLSGLDPPPSPHRGAAADTASFDALQAAAAVAPQQTAEQTRVSGTSSRRAHAAYDKSGADATISEEPSLGFPAVEILVDWDSDSEHDSGVIDDQAEESELHVVNVDAEDAAPTKEHACSAAEWISFIETIETEQNLRCSDLSDALAFEQALGSHRNQVIRYLPLHDRLAMIAVNNPQKLATISNQQILWFGSKSRLEAAQVPPCGLCGMPRVFEVQVMSQLIYYLCRESENELEPAEQCPTQTPATRGVRSEDPRAVLDFGTIAIWTCPRDCVPSSSEICPDVQDKSLPHPYVEEFVYVQPAIGEA